MPPNWSIASTGIFLPFLQRKAKTAVKVLRNGGFRKFMQTCWLKFRQPLLKWREEWEWIQIEGCDYIMVSNVNGFTMLVSGTDEGIGRELAFYRVHEPTVTKLLPGFVRLGDTVLDIGANIGYYTMLLSQLVGGRGTVIAVEPHPDNVRLLELNLRLNRVTNVKVMPVAVSDEVGTAEMFVSDGSNWHSLHPTERTGQRKIVVPTMTIDTIVAQLERSVDLIRMDIEGWETKALSGAEGTLKRDRPTLVVEVHPSYLQKEEVQQFLFWLQSLGYEQGFVVLRQDDFPWVKRPRRVWEKSISTLLTEDALLESGECFTLLLEHPSKR
ncbi:MAG: FkbM family methyltransferase [Armatimonadetes bacterium]|nr:FkbM family methyltransferase [Armatimonadota bacterium]